MPDSILPIRRALISVSDKTGLIILANALPSAGIILLSTGGTAKALREAGFDVTDVSDVTACINDNPSLIGIYYIQINMV